MNMIINAPSVSVPVSNSGRVNFRSKEPISLETMIRLAPSVFAEGAHSSRSERYMHISSIEVLDRMESAGYYPYSIQQGGSRDEVKRNFTKHMIRFRHESVKDLQVGGTLFEICLLNSHDGSSKYKLMGGVFRIACLNGLIVADGRCYSTALPHNIKSASLLVDESNRVLNSVPELNGRIGQFQGIELSDGQALLFAEEANKRTSKILNRSENLFPSSLLLTPIREADMGKDLWTRFNVVQENLIQGGVEYMREGGKHKSGTTRSIRHLQRDVDVNQALWALAAEVAEAA